jgi:hypothetical protein
MTIQSNHKMRRDTKVSKIKSHRRVRRGRRGRRRSPHWPKGDAEICEKNHDFAGHIFWKKVDKRWIKVTKGAQGNCIKDFWQF